MNPFEKNLIRDTVLGGVLVVFTVIWVALAAVQEAIVQHRRPAIPAASVATVPAPAAHGLAACENASKV
jgi:hypothetical protein